MAPADAWEKVRRLALRHLDRFVSLEPKALAGDDPDAIHDIRVASRRLQQVLDLFYPAPRPDELRRLVRRVRRSRRALGEIRNFDVLLERVRKSLRRKRAPYREVWVALEQYLVERRTKRAEKAVRKLSKVNLAMLYVRLKGWISPNGARPGLAYKPPDAAQDAQEDFQGRLARELEKFWQAFETQVAESHSDPRPSLVHAVRIASKRLRYLVEVIAAFEVPGSADSLAWLRGVQRRLGDWHDLEVFERAVIEMVARPEFMRDNLEIAMGAHKLILRSRVSKKKFAEKYFEMTREAAEFERMKEWVDYLVASPPAALTSG